VAAQQRLEPLDLGSQPLVVVEDHGQLLQNQPLASLRAAGEQVVVYPVGVWPGLGAGMESGLE
jgi:hypothetical protein